MGSVKLKKQSLCFKVSERPISLNQCQNTLVCLGGGAGASVDGMCAFVCVCLCALGDGRSELLIKLITGSPLNLMNWNLSQNKKSVFF